MGKPSMPKKWFPTEMAAIRFRAPGFWDDHPQINAPRFDTWAEAHQHLLTKAAQRIEAAKKESAAAKRHLKKVQAMQPPNAPQEAGNEG